MLDEIPFSIGDIVGKCDDAKTMRRNGRLHDETVQIKILVILENNIIVAEVIKLGDFYSANRLTGAHNTSKGFVLNEILTLVPNGNQNSWIIQDPRNRPWHILCCRDGVKSFEA
jgi:hypothetical protein